MVAEPLLFLFFFFFFRLRRGDEGEGEEKLNCFGIRFCSILM